MLGRVKPAHLGEVRRIMGDGSQSPFVGHASFYSGSGGIPPREAATPLGHEPAGEVVKVGDRVEGIRTGDHVVINPMARRDGIIGNGGPTGALSEFLLIPDAKVGHSLA